ncbi:MULTISPECIES: STAS domain-containing protein [unclassified Azospirillum]|jgi:anti-anti-sigma factor|uniref:STAS domain-containing protein n=1 Tax=unclassified Azospirillum TaxID=2630922 RepID=UPI002857C427|nr:MULTISPECIES: STAS domain-containing protein [unclassified Azospirillum]MDR6773945.1 anti-anti-sigma factor [Azospirillum sp. BE72]HYF89552.1 STAS domain-containing protein [Azospirillum sp.]
MDFTVSDVHDLTEIRLSGRMTFTDHNAFRSVIAAMDRPAGHRVVFDLSDLEFVDSTGLGVFFIAHDTARRKDLRLAMQGARDQVHRVFRAANLHGIIPVSA